MKRRQIRTATAAAALLALSGAACGTRVADDRSTAALAPKPASVPTEQSQSAVPTATDLTGSPGAAAPTMATPTPATAGPATGTKAPSGRVTTGGQPVSTGGAAVPSGTSGTAAVGSGGQAPAPVPGAPAASSPRQPGRGSPVLIASAGSYGGPIGAILLPGLQTVQAWTSWINARGGLNGHEVKLIVYDDGGDPARRQAQIQEAIERRGVIAFIHNAAPFESKSTQDYITSKRIPVIGTETGTQSVYESPMYFPQATSGYGNYDAALQSAGQQLVPKGKKRLATLTCVEAQQCTLADKFWSEKAASAGFTVVNRGRTSITQPDYTAECLAAKNAGAEVFLFALDPNSSPRLAASCARQGYKPNYATIASLALDRHKDDPNLDGLTQGSNVFAYFQQGTPATDEYHDVMRTYGSRVPAGGASAVGWVAAKLLEKAGAALPEPPTAAGILNGLWQIRNDTLGGLTQPLTFLPEQKATQTACWINLVIRDRAWVAFDKFNFHCL